MLAKSLLTLAVPLLPLACSHEVKADDATRGGAGAGAAGVPNAGAAGIGGETGGDALIVPQGLSVSTRPGGCGALTVVALTLRQGPSNGELYAALRNDGDTPACSPAFSVEVFDKTEQSVATGLGGLLVRRFYRLTDGSDTIAACVGPDDVTMVAITDLPSDISIDDVGRILYWCNFWALDLVPIDGISITGVRTVTQGTGVAYTGTLVNGFDVALSSPSVAIFPINRVGRPLGVAVRRGTVEVPPGGSWDFETNTVSEPGVDHAAYPAGGS